MITIKSSSKSREEIQKFWHELSGNWEGYCWIDNQERPEIFENRELGNYPCTDNHFIYEACLCQQGKSIEIKQVDDTWLVSEVSWQENDIKDEDIKVYRMAKDENRKLRFAEIWEEEPDPNCDDFPVFKLKKHIFTGFEK